MSSNKKLHLKTLTIIISGIVIVCFLIAKLGGNQTIHVQAQGLQTETLFGTGDDGDLIVGSGQTFYSDNTRSALASSAASGQPNLSLSEFNWF